MRGFVVACLFVSAAGCQQLLNIEEGTRVDVAAGGGGMGGGATGGGGFGGGGGAPDACAARVDLEARTEIFSGLTVPRLIRADAQVAYFVARGDTHENVWRFDHRVVRPTLMAFAPADSSNQTLEHLRLSSDHVSWVTRGLLSRVKVEPKASLGNSSTLHQLDAPLAHTPITSDGPTLFWVTPDDTANGLLRLFMSDPPHDTVTDAAAGEFDVAGDRSIVAHGGAVFTSDDDTVRRYSLSGGGNVEIIATDEGVPDHLLATDTHLYWVAGPRIRRVPFETPPVVDTVVTSPATLLAFDVRADCVVFLDNSGNLGVASAAIGAPVTVLTVLEDPRSLTTTAEHILVVAGDSITRIPWDTTP